MHRLVILVLVGITFVLSFASCNKENEGPLLFITPRDTQFSRQPGQLFEFSIRAMAESGVKHLRITQNFNNTVTQTLLDTTISGKDITIPYPYTVPTSGVNQIYFVFTLTDTEDRTVSIPRRCVVQGAALLTESTGHELFSFYAGDDKLRGFNIASGTGIAVTAQTDSSLIDIMDYPQVNDGVLSRRWRSPSGLKFVRFDAGGFDYANATFASAKSNYTNGVKQDIISNIQLNDRIITKYSDEPEAYAVFSIQGLQDNEGSANDFYVFNMKK